MLIFVANFLFAQVALANSVTPFTAQMMVGGDETPPSVPSPFGATAVTSDQIDLVWGASTDDTALSGYRVFRDAVQIATTTLTTFSDTGLTADTAYTYHVDAFDIFYNYSTSSDFATATTLVEVITPPPATTTPSTDSSGGFATALSINSLIVTPAQFATMFQWTTNLPTRYVIRWGRTDSYELGSVHGGQYLFDHTTVITDLEIATRYFYELEAIVGINGQKAIKRGEFTTSGTIPDQAIPNVLGLQAGIENDSVRLWWNNPSWTEFQKVRIVRSHLFYPQNATDGMVLYDGTDEGYFDEDVFLDRDTWYYAIFVYDKNGRTSSGATVMVSKDGGVLVPPEGSSDEVDLFAMNVALSQGKTTSYLHDPDPFLALEPLFVSIPVTAVPRHLKSIIVTVTHPSRQNQSSSYLLKINPAGTAYETLLPPALEAGQSRLTVTLYNYELATVRTVSNIIIFEIDPRVLPLPDWLKALFPHLLWICFLLLVLILILSRWWREKKVK